MSGYFSFSRDNGQNALVGVQYSRAAHIFCHYLQAGRVVGDLAHRLPQTVGGQILFLNAHRRPFFHQHHGIMVLVIFRHIGRGDQYGRAFRAAGSSLRVIAPQRQMTRSAAAIQRGISSMYSRTAIPSPHSGTPAASSACVMAA